MLRSPSETLFLMALLPASAAVPRHAAAEAQGELLWDRAFEPVRDSQRGRVPRHHLHGRGLHTSISQLNLSRV